MAQHDYIIANQSGAAFRSDLNNGLAAIVSQNSGAAQPSTTYAYQWWADTTTGLLKIRNAANNAWITMRQLDGEFSTVPVENGTAAAPSIYFKDSGTDSGFFSPGTDAVAISTAGANRLHITSAGLVGIGSSAPVHSLQVTASALASVPSAGSSGHCIAIGSAAYGIAGGALTDGNGYLQVTRWDGTATNYNLLLQPNGGNVGIGSNAPSGRLDVETASDTYINFSTSNNGSAAGICLLGNNNDEFFGYANDLRFATITGKNAAGFNERMRIDSGGDVFFNSTVLGFANRRSVDIQTSSTGLIAIQHLNTEVSGAAYVWFVYNGGAIGSITQNGTTAIAYNTTSDYRLKENVTAVTGSITRLQQLKPCKFNFIAEPDRAVDGFLAHEVQDIVPEAITGEKDAVDDDGNPVYQGIDQSKLVPLLTAALQEAIGRIETLEAEVSTLKGA